jgi:hypothetical protein
MPKRIPKIVIALLIVGYLLFATALMAGMFAARQSLVPELSTSQSQADWNAWRAEAATQDGRHGPVQRTVPKSPEPPMLVLMRDYFPACVVGLLLPLSALYAVIAWMACGVMRQAKEASLRQSTAEAVPRLTKESPSPSGRGPG